MPDDRQPRDAFEAALSRGLEHQLEGVGTCPDADLLAAFWERSLPSDERQVWEMHVATCGRCQAQLAALTRLAEIEETGPGAPRFSRFWAFFDWRWVAPVATAAVVLLAVWSADPESLPEQTTTTNRNDSAGAGPDQLSQDAQLSVESFEAPRRERQSAAVPEREDAPAESDTLARLDEIVPANEPAAADAEVRAESPEVVRPAAAPAETTVQNAERRLAETAFGARSAAAQADLFRDAGPTIAITTPDRLIIWRIMTDGGIERSTDGGSSWAQQRMASGTELTAGSAPSVFVCWVVGRAGLILRTLDGGMSWRQVTAPTGADLVGVSATDDRSARVEAADGTSFRTDDGGTTWEPAD